MVQKYTAPVRIFKYPFELVMAAYERRFPTCHLIPVFVGSDKIHENINEDGSIHVTERRCRIRIDAPYILRKMVGADEVLFIQKNTLNKRKRVLKIEAKNESFSTHINIHELCYYRVCPENENWTIFEQQASLEIKSFWGFEMLVEKLAVKHYSQNIKKGSEIIEYHINELAEEGITSMPRYEFTSNQIYSDNEDNDDEDDCFIDTNAIKKTNGLLIKDPTQQSTTESKEVIENNNNNNNNNKRSTNKSKFDFRSNSMEEKIQATKQKIISKCESLGNSNKKNKNPNPNSNNNNNNSSFDNNGAVVTTTTMTTAATTAND